jgi:hypothetical protein
MALLRTNRDHRLPVSCQACSECICHSCVLTSAPAVVVPVAGKKRGKFIACVLIKCPHCGENKINAQKPLINRIFCDAIESAARMNAALKLLHPEQQKITTTTRHWQITRQEEAIRQDERERVMDRLGTALKDGYLRDILVADKPRRPLARGDTFVAAWNDNQFSSAASSKETSLGQRRNNDPFPKEFGRMTAAAATTTITTAAAAAAAATNTTPDQKSTTRMPADCTTGIQRGQGYLLHRPKRRCHSECGTTATTRDEGDDNAREAAAPVQESVFVAATNSGPSQATLLPLDSCFIRQPPSAYVRPPPSTSTKRRYRNIKE